MIAKVIPYTRTIRGKELFDYRIPQELKNTIRVGQFVWVEFRSQVVPALVWNIQKQSSVDKKRLKDVLNTTTYAYAFDQHRIAWMRWFAEYYGISLAHVLKTIQYPLVHTLRTVDVFAAAQISRGPASRLQSIQVPLTAAKKIVSAVRTIQTTPFTVLHYSHRDDCISAYNGLISSARGPILIILPEYSDLSQLMPSIKRSGVPILSIPDQASPSLWYAIEQQLHTYHASQQTCVVLTTKRGALLDPKLFTLIVVDQEESPLHKQSRLNPRYHVRTVMNAMHTLYGPASPRLLFTSHAPSLELYYAAQKRKQSIIDIRRVWKEDHIECISMEEEYQKKNYTWFSDALINRIHQSKKTLLFLNRTGKYSIAICQDCHVVLPTDATQCSQCAGFRVSQKRKGIMQLTEELRQIVPKKTIVYISSEHISDTVEQDILKADIVVATEKIFRLTSLSLFDCIGILSVDHLLVYPHFRAHERVFQLLTAFFAHDAHVVLQTHSPNHPVIQAALQNDYTGFAEQELSLRQQLQLPPIVDYIQLVHKKTGRLSVVKGTFTPEQLGNDVMVDRH